MNKKLNNILECEYAETNKGKQCKYLIDSHSDKIECEYIRKGICYYGPNWLNVYPMITLHYNNNDN